MKRLKPLIVFFVYIFASLFYVNGIYGYLMMSTEPVVNQFTVEDDTTYQIYYYTMNTDGSTYSEYSHTDLNPTKIGSSVTAAVITIEGFNTPTARTETIDTFNNYVFDYYYERKQYTLTIENDSYVTSNVSEGLIYYDVPVHLEAAAEDALQNPFVRWSDGDTNRVKDFHMTEDVTIEPIYATSYLITYDPNNGNASISNRVIQNEAITTFPSVDYHDCSSGTGTYQELGCTYVYKLLGWYTEPSCVNKVDESFVPTGDTILYAKWNKIYFANDGPVEFDGDDYIDTGVQLFSQENARKDFIATFTVDSYDGYNPVNNTDKRATIFTCMKEGVAPYYGVHFYHDDNNYVVNANSSNNASDKYKNPNTGYSDGTKVILKRENGIVYFSYDDGVTFTPTVNFSSFTSYFDNPATFGAGLNKNLVPYRYLIGTLSDMSVEIFDRPSYTIHFDANGGNGVMADQIIELGESTTLTHNKFTHNDATFGEWNTEPDGSGTSYANDYAITTDLGNDGDEITLYAQWIPPQHFYVHFDPNGGTGTMNNQSFIISGAAVPLTQNAFTRTNYEFRGWNTEPDGSGTHYDDTEAVRDLSLVDEEVVTLYAEWWKIQFGQSGDVVFDGTSTTFIDTGVNVFSSTNMDKDFEIRFTFKSVDSDQIAITPGDPKQPTMFNVKDESNSKYPGFNVRFNGNINKIYPTYRCGGDTQNVASNGISVSDAPIEFIYRRKTVDNKKVITVQYKYNGYDSGEKQMIDQSAWTLNQPFATNVAFGGYFDGNNQPGRFFKGTLADIVFLMDD